jgi:lantibiotic biosynthesis protein
MSTVAPPPPARRLPYAPAGFFVLRTPVLPFDELIALGRDLRAASLASGDDTHAPLEDAWRADTETVRARLRDILTRPVVRHALFVASPSLEVGLTRWFAQPESKDGRQAERAVMRYLARMCGRPTPFGLFSGFSVGTIAEEPSASTDLVLAGLPHYRAHTRIDYETLSAWVEDLTGRTELASALPVTANTSLFKVGEVWHYIECRTRDRARSYHAARLTSDAYLDTAIARSRGGATPGEIIAALQARAVADGEELPASECQEYVEELLGNDVLTSSLTPLVSGDPVRALLDQCAALEPADASAAGLAALQSGLAAIDRRGLGADPAEYRRLAAPVAAAPAALEAGHLFQIDLSKPLERAVLSHEVIEELLRGLDLLCRFGTTTEPADLTAFREAFNARYDRRRIPLLEALDPEIGVGFGHEGGDPSPLVRGVHLPRRGGASPQAEGQDAMLLEWLLQSAGAVPDVLRLRPEDLPRDAPFPDRLPESLCIVATVSSASRNALQAGEFEVHVKGGVGPGGGQLFGRFSHADPALYAAMRQLMRTEQTLAGDAICAEIVHAPEGRIGNVLCRPLLRDYDLVYLGRSDAPADRQIPASDLSVYLEGNELRLWSARLQRRIIPRLTNAHGHRNPRLLPCYRFLCALQQQGGMGVPAFDLGTLGRLAHIPRVMAGRVVLVTAWWLVPPASMQAIAEADGASRFARVQQVRRDLRLPRWILYEEADQALPVDLDNPLSVDAFVHVARRASRVMLREMYPPPDRLCVEGPEGRFTHEVMVPLLRTTSTPTLATRSSASIQPIARTEESRPPGSDWLYLKLYGGRAALEDALVRVRQTMAADAAARAFDTWFFVRYADPETHLRVRFHGSPDLLARRLLPEVSQALGDLLAARRVWKIQVDTYERELERYGGAEGMAASEDLFCADSDAVSAIVADPSLATPADRWLVACLGIDALLQDFGMDLTAKRDMLAARVATFRGDFEIGAKEKDALAKQWRRLRPALESVFRDGDGDAAAAGSGARVKEIFARRSPRIVQVAARLREVARRGDLPVTLDDLLASYLHMHVNRVLWSWSRQHEFVLYDCLSRSYAGLAARRDKVAG